MFLAFMGWGVVAVFVHPDGEVDQRQPKKSRANCASNTIVPCVLEFVWQCQVMHILRACIDASALLLFAVEPSPNPIPKVCMAEDPLYCSSTLSWVQVVPNKPL
jgi:hypothetical protein